MLVGSSLAILRFALDGDSDGQPGAFTTSGLKLAH